MLLLAAIWGCSFLFISIGVRELHPAYLALGRVVAGALVLLIILAIKRESLPREPRIWAHTFVLGAIGSALPWTLFGYGEQRVPSLLAGIWNGITPLVVLPIAVLVFRTEKFTLQRVVGLLLGFVGMMVVLGAWQLHGGADLNGQLFCMAAACSYGVAIPYQKRFIAGSKLSGTALSAGLLLCATVQLAVVAPIVAGHAPPMPWSLSLEVVASVVALGALGRDRLRAQPAAHPPDRREHDVDGHLRDADLRDHRGCTRPRRAPHLVPAGRRIDRAHRGGRVPGTGECCPIRQEAENPSGIGCRASTIAGRQEELPVRAAPCPKRDRRDGREAGRAGRERFSSGAGSGARRSRRRPAPAGFRRPPGR
jgi:drug/metabolite transporter (DMT)-like permease